MQNINQKTISPNGTPALKVVENKVKILWDFKFQRNKKLLTYLRDKVVV